MSDSESNSENVNLKAGQHQQAFKTLADYNPEILKLPEDLQREFNDRFAKEGTVDYLALRAEDCLRIIEQEKLEKERLQKEAEQKIKEAQLRVERLRKARKARDARLKAGKLRQSKAEALGIPRAVIYQETVGFGDDTTYPKWTSEVEQILNGSLEHSRKVLDYLSLSSDAEVKELVASHPRTPPKVIERLSRDSEGSCLNACARNPNTPALLLKRLYKKNPFGVLGNPSVPKDLLKRVIKSKSIKELMSVLAGNPSTPVDILTDIISQLAESEFVEFFVTGIALASNPSLSVGELPRLVKLSEKFATAGAVAYAAANRKDLNLKLFNLFFNWPNRSKRGREARASLWHGLSENPHTPREYFKELSEKFPYEVAGNPSTPADVLRRLVDRKYAFSFDKYYVLRCVVDNDSAPASLLIFMAKRYPMCRFFISQNARLENDSELQCLRVLLGKTDSELLKLKL